MTVAEGAAGRNVPTGRDYLAPFLLGTLQSILLLFVVADPLFNRLTSPAVGATGALLVVPGVVAAVCILRFPARFWVTWLFFLFLAVNGVVATSNDLLAADFVRGLVPYAVYFAVLTATVQLSPCRQRKLLKLYVVVATLLSFRTFGVLAVNGVGPGAFAAGTRATFFDLYSSLVLSTCAVPLALTLFRSGPLRAFILGALLAQILVSMSKSLIGLTAIAVAAWYVGNHWAGIRRSPVRLIRVGIVGFVSLLAVAVVWDDIPFLSRFALALSSPATELSGRFIEMQNALEAFRRSPIVGEGIGYVFTHVSDPSTGLEVQQRRYTHSALFFHLATTGVVGTLLYLLWIFRPFVHGLLGLRSAARNSLREADHRAVVISAMTVLAILFVTAGFRNVQTVIVLGMLNGILIQSMPGRRRVLSLRLPSTRQFGIPRPVASGSI